MIQTNQKNVTSSFLHLGLSAILGLALTACGAPPSNLNGLGVLAEATGKSIPEIGVTTFRPPYTPYSFGAIAGA